MNSDQIKGSWTRAKGMLRERWGKLTDDELDQAEGKWEQVTGLVQQRYGDAKEEIEAEISRIRSRYADETTPSMPTTGTAFDKEAEAVAGSKPKPR